MCLGVSFGVTPDHVNDDVVVDRDPCFLGLLDGAGHGGLRIFDALVPRELVVEDLVEDVFACLGAWLGT